MNANVNTGTCLSQKKQILAWMRTGQPITQLQAWRRFGCSRLGARIAEIRADVEKAGETVTAEWSKDPKSGKRYKAYRLVKLA